MQTINIFLIINELIMRTKFTFIAFMLSLFLLSCGSSEENDKSSTKDMKTGTNNSIDNDAGLEESRRVYRKGYSDGQTGYGLPASQRGSADDFIMAYGYNFSSADYYVYKMGFQDGLYGRPKQY